MSHPDDPIVDAIPLTDTHGRLLGHVPTKELDYPSEIGRVGASPVDLEHPPNVCTSVYEGTLDTPLRHRLVLDIDWPARLVPLSTPDHFHLYVEHPPCEHDDYLDFIEVATRIGLIGTGYGEFSTERGYTVVRTHGTKPLEQTFAFGEDWHDPGNPYYPQHLEKF